MKTKKNILNSITWFFIVILLVLFTGCKVKKKLVERSTQAKEITTHKTVNQVKTADLKIEAAVQFKTEQITIKEDSKIELTQADADKKIIIEDAAGKKIIITGANAIITRSIKQDRKIDTSTVVTSYVDRSTQTKSVTVQHQEKTKVKTRNTNTSIVGTSTWLWIVIIIIVIFLIVLKKNKLYELYKKVLP